MEKLYKKVKIFSLITWLGIAAFTFALLIQQVNFFLVLFLALVLGFALNFAVLALTVKAENNKAFINHKIKRKVVSSLNKDGFADSFVLVNVMDMLLPNAKDTTIVKIVTSTVEKGRIKNKDTYYIKNSDDSINQMVKTITNYSNIIPVSLEEVEEILHQSNKRLVFFNIFSYAKLLSESKHEDYYQNVDLIDNTILTSKKYKPYNPYIEAIYQNNGLVLEKTDYMVDVYLSIYKDKDIEIKDFLNLGGK